MPEGVSPTPLPQMDQEIVDTLLRQAITGQQKIETFAFDAYDSALIMSWDILQKEDEPTKKEIDAAARLKKAARGVLVAASLGSVATDPKEAAQRLKSLERAFRIYTPAAEAAKRMLAAREKRQNDEEATEQKLETDNV